MLSERSGKVLQKRQSISINRQDISTSINTQMDALIPASKISCLSQGMFVGAVADSFDQPIEQKIFHCEIVVDAEKVKREEKAYKPIPVITDFTDENGLYEGNGAGELQTHQGGGETDCHRRAGAYRW